MCRTELATGCHEVLEGEKAAQWLGVPKASQTSTMYRRNKRDGGLPPTPSRRVPPSPIGRSPPPIRFGGGLLPFLSTSFLFFAFFLLSDEIGTLGWPHQPTKGWCATHGPIRSSPGWVAPSSKTSEPIHHSRYFTGNARNLSGTQMQHSYISIFISAPLRKPL